ncbi:MAG: acyl carrier protein [Desulfuromonadaceae bacterium]|nr:acyl carrier protein [Desulfuromonadaceae bacterium]MDD2848935.1 acyl carrier protein [Desulfuromonadaceae bacterium]MDD4131697.1 acyl carrier protein [Desulfuromonadaceae bacterium]
MSVLKKLENYLLTEIAAGLGKKTLEPDEDLLELGIIDSLGLMKLISFMEEDFGIRIPDEEVVPENFQSLTSMARLVELQEQN